MSVLKAENVTHYFDGSPVSGFNLNLEPYELVGIIALTAREDNHLQPDYRRLQSDAREHLIRGHGDRRQTPSAITALGIARTFQKHPLFKELSVLDNVRIAITRG